MSLHVIETGEIVEEMSRVEAERITSRIADKLDTIADNLEQVLPLIGEALTREAWRALGYVSPTAYVSERFAGALTRLPVEVRRPVVSQLSAAGMSTRAIAPIVGKSQQSVSHDLQVTNSWSPAPEPAAVAQPEAPVAPAAPDLEPVFSPAQPPKITGMDGKQYTRPEPVERPAEPKRPPLPDQLFNAVYDLGKVIDRLNKLTNDDRFPRTREQAALKHENDLNRYLDTLHGIISKFH